MFNSKSVKNQSNLIGETPFLVGNTFYELHRSQPIEAHPRDIIEAVTALDMRNDKFTNTMLLLREFPDKVFSKFRKTSRNINNPPFGFDTFTLLERNDNELSMGLIGRFWRPVLAFQEINSGSEFYSFGDPTMAKLVLRFLVLESQESSSTLITETFIFCPNLRTKILCTPYWIAIRLASGSIRRRMLKLVEENFAKE